MTTKKLARLFRATANEKRIFIIRGLRRAMTINTLADYTGLPYKTVERHLKILVSVNLIKQNREGLEVNFKLNNEGANRYLHTVLEMIHSAK